jgi:hypothetical protein
VARRLWTDAVPSRTVRARALWIVVTIVVIVGLAAWATTCTGPRPRPTGQTIPPPSDVVSTTTLP